MLRNKQQPAITLSLLALLIVSAVFTCAHGSCSEDIGHSPELPEASCQMSSTDTLYAHPTYTDAMTTTLQSLHRPNYIQSQSCRSGKYSFMEYNMVLQTLFNNGKTLCNSSDSWDTMPPWRDPLSSEMQKEKQCRQDLNNLFSSASNESHACWAKKMLDAWGKPGAGMLKKRVHVLGDFDECLEVETNATFSSQYCVQNIDIQKFPTFPHQRVSNFEFKTTLVLGVCVPSTCSDEILKRIFNECLASLSDISATVNRTECRDRDPALDDKAIAVIWMLGIFAGLMTVATLYDIIIVQGLWKLNSSETQTRPTWLPEHGAGDSLREGRREHRAEYEPLLSLNKSPNYLPSAWGKLLLAFSVYTNGSKLLSPTASIYNIDCINGIRFISMTWIHLAHIFSLVLPYADNFQEYLDRAYQRWTFQAVVNALVAVDTFFVLSGLLMMYFAMKELQRSLPEPRFFLYFYLHRFWRLSPPYMFVLVTYVTLFKYMGEGPLWSQKSEEYDNCDNNWWTNLLYINNLVNERNMCMGWTWYLATDMQFYIISPLIFIPVVIFAWKGFLVLGLLLVGVTVTSGVISSVNNLSPNINLVDPKSYYFDYYIKPYCRLGPYLVGMVLGYILHVSDLRSRMKTPFALLGWIIATIVALAVVYGLYDHERGEVEVAALYNALHRIAWAVVICWVIFACSHDIGGFVNSFLSWTGFIPLSRLTYCAYLVHPLVIKYFLYSQRNVFYINNTNITFIFTGTLTVTFAVALLAFLTFEAPMLGLEKVFLSDLLPHLKAFCGRLLHNNRHRRWFRSRHRATQRPSLSREQSLT